MAPRSTRQTSSPVRTPVPADAVFFREWQSRSVGERRSLSRADQLRRVLGLDRHRRAALVVVGSKGKGTTAIFASAYLAAAGCRTITVSSPSLLTSGERIRDNGAAVPEQTLTDLGNRLSRAIDELPPRTAPGYLSPGGLFTIAGLLHAADVHADVVVLEAGRGGAADEVSLIDADVVALTPLFEEHLEELGGTLASVVQDKCGVIGPATVAVVTGPQSAAATAHLHGSVIKRTAGRLVPEGEGPAGVAHPAAPDQVPDHLLAAGLGRDNARLGCRAARRLLTAGQIPQPDPQVLAATLGTVSLPGRLSVHGMPGHDTELLIDAAISRPGYAAAIEHARQRWGSIDHVLVSLPDDKDHEGAAAELAGLPVTFVDLRMPHLRYSRPVPPTWNRVGRDEVDRAFVAGLGRRMVGLGTISFIAHLLRLVGASTGVAFDAP